MAPRRDARERIPLVFSDKELPWPLIPRPVPCRASRCTVDAEA